MNELFIEVGNKKEPIQQDIIEKYHLKKGIKSPFSGTAIVDRNGDATAQYTEHARITDVEESQIIYTTSEILG